MTLFPLAAVDIGNNRIKCGWFMEESTGALPAPRRTMVLADSGGDPTLAQDILAEAPHVWWIASVNRPSATRLIGWLRSHRPDDSITLLAAGDLPLRVAVDRPDMVGIDRLLDAVAANRLRRKNHAAVVVDVGTAITVDLVSDEGVFLGGAILPGIAMAARALHTFTDLLPWIDMSELLAAPPALGTTTHDALRSGLFWGAVGAIRQLIVELAARYDDRCDVFLTGGASPAVAALVGPSAQHVPHLTLAGIALTARSRAER